MEEVREDFREYLLTNGVFSAFRRVLVKLFQEPQRPESPLEYIKKYFGNPSGIDILSLSEENMTLRSENASLKSALIKLQQENSALKDDILDLEEGQK